MSEKKIAKKGSKRPLNKNRDEPKIFGPDSKSGGFWLLYAHYDEAREALKTLLYIILGVAFLYAFLVKSSFSPF